MGDALPTGVPLLRAPEPEASMDAVKNALSLGAPLALPDAHALTDTALLPLAEVHGDCEGVLPLLPLGNAEMVKAPLPVALSVNHAVGDTVAEPLGDAVTRALPLGEAVPHEVGLKESVTRPVPEALPLPLAVPQPVRDAVAQAVAPPLPVRKEDAEKEALPVREGLPLPAPVALGEGTPVALPSKVADGKEVE